jgi:hippurate hydrolase
MGCRVSVTLDGEYPTVVNSKKETEHVIRLAQTTFGKEHFSQADVPICASEDFSYFLHEKPGCFFALGTLKPGEKPNGLHTSKYNYNDDMIATGAFFWLKLVEDRLCTKIL